MTVRGPGGKSFNERAHITKVFEFACRGSNLDPREVIDLAMKAAVCEGPVRFIKSCRVSIDPLGLSETERGQ